MNPMVASMSLNAGILADVVLLAIIVWKLVSGARSGLVRMLGGLISLIGGIWAGIILKNLLADTVAELWIAPAIGRILERAKDNLGLSDLLENLQRILDNAELPDFLKLNVPEQVRQMQENGATAVANATQLIARRLAGWLLFLLGLILASLLLRLLFSGVIAPLIDHIPLVNETNRALGGILGTALGILLAGLLLFLCYKLLPVLSENSGRIFAEDSVEGSILMKQYFRLLPGIFKS